jgi:hypothetical protein
MHVHLCACPKPEPGFQRFSIVWWFSQSIQVCHGIIKDHDMAVINNLSRQIKDHDMALENQLVVCDKQKNVAALNRLMGSQHPHLYLLMCRCKVS